MRLHTNSGEHSPAGTRTLIGTTTISLMNAQSGTLVTTPLRATVPAGTGELVMELAVPSLQEGGSFAVGSNPAPETV